MKKKIINIGFEEYDNPEEMSLEDKHLLNQAKSSIEHAHAPYSNFFVGAAVLLENGKIFTGSNQENVAYPSGLCAERVAVFYASSQYPEVPIKTIAVTGSAKHFNINRPITPCGACRQVMAEYENKQKQPIRLIFSAENGKSLVFQNVESILPVMFKAEELKRNH